MSRKRLIIPAIMALAGFVTLIGLGVWQLERKSWKEALIARIEARAQATPISLADAATAKKDGSADLDFTRVQARGRFLNGREFHVLTPLREGAGWSIVTPFETKDGIVLVDRGTVPDALKDPARRAQGQVDGEVEITGWLHGSDRTGSFTPDNDPARNIWYGRDLAGMRAALPADLAGRVLPFFLALEPSAGATMAGPKPREATVDLRNDHLQYAITWFLLAAVLAGMFFFLVRKELKTRGDGPRNDSMPST